jgi:hypothetical protein
MALVADHVPAVMLSNRHVRCAKRPNIYPSALDGLEGFSRKLDP